MKKISVAAAYRKLKGFSMKTRGRALRTIKEKRKVNR